tara:strand:+ start:881 stop:1252 length:372 start_codon:yes stop_codon:yes gene_type:complete
MGTRSNVYVETDPGTYLGTYCHYDGYPAHMFTALSEMSHDRLLGHILIAMTQGGFRIIDGENTEYLRDTTCVIMTDPHTEDWGPDYIYIKRLDDAVQWRCTFQQEHPDTYDEKNMGWHFTEDG